MSDSDLEETSQTENSQEIDPISKVSQSEGSQTTKPTLQNTQKKHKRRQEKICGTSYKYLPGWSTSNMNSHLADEHDIIDFPKKKKVSGSQQMIDDMLQRVAPYKGEKKLNIYRAVVEWLVVDNRSFDIINGEGFRRFMLQIDPAFRRPSYRALKKEISMANLNAKSQIKDLLET
ncbi:26995_t:CDS:2, partial [Gigaspora margarita]